MNHHVKCFFDIETLPDMRPETREYYASNALKNFKSPSTLTKERAAFDLGLTDKDDIKFTSKDSMIAKWEAKFSVLKAAEMADIEWRKTSFDGGYGKICVIGYAFDDAPAKTIICYDEKAGISAFFNEISQTKAGNVEFVGHNITGFDIPFLWKRAVINRLPHSSIPKDVRHGLGRVFDTMIAWAGYKERISLDDLAKVLGFESHKTEMDGSMVCDTWLCGKHDEVAAYCIKDVDLTRQIYEVIK